MQIKKGTQNLRSWVHRMLCHPQAWVPRALIPHQVGLSELSRPAVQDWRCQTQGHMCPSSKAATFTVPLAQTAFLLKEALGMMAHSGPMDDTSVPKCLPQRKRAINSHHQNPVLSQIALAQFSEVSLILGTSSKPVDKASPTVFYASSKSPSLWYLLCPFPGTHKWSQQSPNVGLPTNCPVPWACFSAQVHLSIELLMKGYFDAPKATVERKQKSTDINPGQEPGLWVQGSILWRLKVLQLAEEKEQNHQPEWPPTFRLFFSYQLLL